MEPGPETNYVFFLLNSGGEAFDKSIPGITERHLLFEQAADVVVLLSVEQHYIFVAPRFFYVGFSLIFTPIGLMSEREKTLPLKFGNARSTWQGWDQIAWLLS